jgi:ribosome-associated translation inhibitor RaiA
MHVLLDNQNLIPSIINVTTGKTADITEAKRMELNEKLEKGDFLIFDRGYRDY